MNEWLDINLAPKIAGREIVGCKLLYDVYPSEDSTKGAFRWVYIKEPFVTFWSPTLNKFYCNPTHWIPMPIFPPHA